MHYRALFLAVLFLVALSDASLGQRARISGRVIDAEGPVAGAYVLASIPGIFAISDDEGRFNITNAPTGRYDIRVLRIGYRSAELKGVVVNENTPEMSIQMYPSAVRLDGVVITASRRPERLVHASSSVSVVDEAQVVNTIGNSYAPALKAVKGVEFNQVGVTSVSINARGFNTPVNTRVLMLEDRRVATMPETGLPLASYTTIPKLDIAGIEFLSGPGSALYGANAGNGVLSLQTKDPRDWPGIDLEISAGSRQFTDVQARFAGTHGDWGVKTAAEYQYAEEWEDTLNYTNATRDRLIPEKGNDSDTHVTRFTGGITRYLGDSRLSFTAGTSHRDGLVKNSIGRVLSVGHTYGVYQFQYTSPRWFAQAYGFKSNTGRTLQLNTVSQLTAANLLPLDIVLERSRFPARSTSRAFDLENNFTVGSVVRTGWRVADHAHLIWGAHYRQDRVSSGGTVFLDRLTGKPLTPEYGAAYVQLEAPLNSYVRVVAAARHDWDSRYAEQLSPKFAMVYSRSNHTFRVSYNRGYRAPAFLSTALYVPNIAGVQGVFANVEGYEIRDSAQTVRRVIDPLRVEKNDTWELAYKAVLGQRFFADVTLYHSQFIDFLTNAVIIGSAAADEYVYNLATGAALTTKTTRTILGFFNIGEATTSGLDADMRLLMNERVSMYLTAGLNRFGNLDIQGKAPGDVAKFNASPARITTGINITNLPRGVDAGVSARYVNGYDFRGGVDYGHLPGFGTIDVNAAYRIPGLRTTILLQGSNLFTCVGGVLTPPPFGIHAEEQATYVRDRKCGFGVRHRELLNMPAIGSMIFVGVRWSSR